MSLPPKLVAFDLDGTLNLSRLPPTPQMLALLLELTHHTTVAITSGGSFQRFQDQFITPWLAFSPTLPSNLYLLPVNGGQCYQYVQDHWQTLFSSSFVPATKSQLLTALKTIKYSVPSFIDDRGSQVTFLALGLNAPLDQKAKWDPDRHKRQLVKSQLEALGLPINIYLGGTTSIDILPPDVNKALGLQKLLTHLHLGPSDLIYVGDATYPGGNDHVVLQSGLTTLTVKDPTDTAAIIGHWLISTSSQPKVNRPWGYFQHLSVNNPATIKLIHVEPNQSLSLQSHEHRSEYWLTLSGYGPGIKPRQQQFIPAHTKHQLAADEHGLEVLEVSTGDFDETDIIRFSDRYGRV